MYTVQRMQRLDENSPETAHAMGSDQVDRCAHIQRPASHKVFGKEHITCPQCRNALKPSTCDTRKEILPKHRQIAAEKAAKLQERVRELRRLLEADYRLLNGPPAKTNTVHPTFPTIHNDSHLEITLSYNSSSASDTSSSFDSVASDDQECAYQDTCRPNSQSTDLRGIGQWIGVASRQPCQVSRGTNDGPDLDLAHIHALAVRTPFERYLQARGDQEGRFRKYMYLLLP